MLDDPETTLRCPSCHAQRVPGAKFCRECGLEFNDSESETLHFKSSNSTLPEEVSSTTPIGPLTATSIGPIDPDFVLSSMPVLQKLAREKAANLRRVFEKYYFVFILHFLTDLLGFMEAFRLMGMSWNDVQF